VRGGGRSGGRNRKTPTLQLSEMLECGWVYGIVLCLNVVVHPVSEALGREDGFI
jgi:hypothetical protein